MFRCVTTVPPEKEVLLSESHIVLGCKVGTARTRRDKEGRRLTANIHRINTVSQANRTPFLTIVVLLFARPSWAAALVRIAQAASSILQSKRGSRCP